MSTYRFRSLAFAFPGESLLDVFRRGGAPAVGITPQGEIVLWNDGAAEMFGLTEEEALSRRCHLVLPGADLFGNRYCGAHCPLFEMRALSEPIRPMELTFRRRDGDFRAAVLTVNVPMESGVVVLVHLFHEIRSVIAPAPAPLPAPRNPALPVVADDGPLTARELQVLRRVAVGESAKDIARNLGISTATVRNHLQHIFGKLDVHGKLEAVARAHELGILDPAKLRRTT